MAEIIEMPKLSDTMEVGTIVNWLKKEGDPVAIGDMLCEVETDKATMELENLVADGVLLKIYIDEEGEAPLGAPICAIGEAGEEPPEVGAPAKNDEAEAEEPEPEPHPEAADLPEPQGRKAEYTPEADSADDTEGAAAAESGGRIKISPLARKLAEKANLALGKLKVTGPGGRIVKKDVQEAIDSGTATASEAPSGDEASASGKAATFAPTFGADIAKAQQIKVSGMRKAIAKRLVESKTQLPHFYLQTEIDAGALLKLRATVNEGLAALAPEQGGIKLSVNDFILKASAEALRRVPSVNTSWMGDHIQQHGAVHMAFGVAIPDGLVTPVIRDAHAKGLRQIAAEAKQLIAKARDKKLKPEEMSGSTFTVTNLGMYGISAFYGIINPPNAAILSVGATVKKPVVNEKDEIVVGQRMTVSLSGDHRVIDGAGGAEFLVALKDIIENPALILV
jgi:pyruvate dehydrogenase E2 component (dihydrolipoamide acetyltransferase)